MATENTSNRKSQQKRKSPEKLAESFKTLAGKPEPESEARAAERIAVMREARRYRGVGEKFIDIDLSKIPPGFPPEYCRMAGRLKGLVDRPAMIALLGDRGVGKTAMACGLVRHFQERGRPYVFILRAQKYLSMLSDAPWGKKEQIRDKFNRADLVVLDEVDRRHAGEWGDGEFQMLIDERYANERATVLICNLTVDAFKADVDLSVYRRVYESRQNGGGIFLCRWPRIDETMPLDG